jgi:membrane associated rhomboid family serine protease
VTTANPAPAPRASPARILPARPVAAAVFMLAVVALLWVIEFVDQAFFATALDDYGIEPRRIEGLDGILFAPLLHGGFDHLAANTVPLLVLGFLVLAGGFGQFVAVTALIWVFSGVAVWLLGAGLTVGASGIIFGWLAFLLFRGFFARSGRQIVLAVVLFLVYGSVLWGVLPSDPRISWQAHLFGAVAGVVAARLTAAADRSSPAPRSAAG